MPKVRPLTEQQAISWEVERISRETWENVGAERGRRDWTHEKMAEFLGMGLTSYCTNRRDGIGKINVLRFVSMLWKIGFRIQIVPAK